MKGKNIIFVFYFNIAYYSQIFYNEHRLMLKLEEINVKKYVKNFKIGYPEEFKNHTSWNEKNPIWPNVFFR